MIAIGQPLMAIVSEDLWVTANYKETQLTKMRPGRRPRSRSTRFPTSTFEGHVDSIQRATGAYFSVLPAENATGNYVKVVQRVPVKIVFDDDRVRKYASARACRSSPTCRSPRPRAMAASAAAPLPRSAAGDHNPWLIAIVVSLATFMEVLDTTIANVSLRHIAGGLGASQDESTWILTSYLISNAIILPISGWLSR